MFSVVTNRSPHLHRLVAMLGVALALALSVFAVRPDAHEWLHHHDNTPACNHSHSSESHQDNDAGDIEGCVITQFAQGHVLAALIFVSLLLVGRVLVTTFIVDEALVLSTPHFRLPHGCGPPAV